MARTLKWLLVSILVTVVGTGLLWLVFGPGALFGFLFLPFAPMLFGRGGGTRRETAAVRTCPRCGFRSGDPDDRYCPRDGGPLV